MHADGRIKPKFAYYSRNKNSVSIVDRVTKLSKNQAAVKSFKLYVFFEKHVCSIVRRTVRFTVRPSYRMLAEW